MPNGPPVQVRATSGSELSRQVPVDLKADADLNEGRGAPGHWSLPYHSRVPTKVDRAGQLRKPLQPQGRTHTLLTQQGNSIADRPAGLPVTTPAAYHCEEKRSRCLAAAAMSLSCGHVVKLMHVGSEGVFLSH